MKEDCKIKTPHDFLLYLYKLTDNEAVGYHEVCQMARKEFVKTFGIEKQEVLAFISHFAEIMKRHGELDSMYEKLSKQIINKDKLFICKKLDWLY